MNILFTICGRAGSKGIKNKNNKDFCGYPLVYYSLSVIDLIQNIMIDETMDIVVNSNSKELLDLTRKNPFFELTSIYRADKLSGDSIPKMAVIRDCLKRMEAYSGKEYDIVIDLDITSPLRTIGDMKNLIETHIKTGADVTTSVTDARRNPYFNMVRKTEHGYQKVLSSNYTSRQQAPEIFDMNASLYAYNPEFLIKGKGVLEGYCECIYMYDTGILDLDCENDFELMQVIATYLYEKRPEFAEIQNNIKEKMSCYVN